MENFNDIACVKIDTARVLQVGEERKLGGDQLGLGFVERVEEQDLEQHVDFATRGDNILVLGPSGVVSGVKSAGKLGE